MEKHILSKSTYIKGEQCLKQLYLHKKRSFLRDRMPAERLAIFSRGTNVGVYAQEIFPGGIDAGPKHPSQYRKAVVTTSQLIDAGQKVIYEAAFQANRTLILLDIIVKNGDAWDAYEVKSSKSLSETYYKDAALQYYVLINAGIKINSFSLIHIDANYERIGDVDKDKLFITTDVTNEVKERYDNVEANINNQIEMLNEEHSPKIEIGKHCFSPYDCDFIGHCWKKVKKPSVFDIPAINPESRFEYLQLGKDLASLQNNEDLSKVQQQQIEVQISGKEHFALCEDSRSKLLELQKNSENLFAVKILQFTPALPLYDNTKPYQPIAFAYSIMQINGDEKSIELFISDGKSNPDIEINARLNGFLENRSFVSYNNRNKSFKSFDLRNICLENSFYHPAMNKNYSNKELSKALGNRPAWKSIESDIVAAQYYDEVLRGHKKSEEKYAAIEAYLRKEVLLVQKFMMKVQADLNSST